MNGRAGRVNARNPDPMTLDREKRRRALTALVFILVLVATPLVSASLLSVHERNGTFVVEPGSHKTLYAGVFGFGKIEYSFTHVSGPAIYVVEVDRVNYGRLVDGKSYSYTGYSSLSIGGGQSSEAGTIWEKFFVFVNEEYSPTTVEYDFEVTSYFNMLATGAMLAAVGAAYALYTHWIRRKEPQQPVRVSGRQRRIVWRAMVAICVLAALPFIVMSVLGLLIPAEWSIFFGFAFYRFFLGVLIATLLTAVMNFRLRVVEGQPRAILSDLTHRLRVSRYSVSEKPRVISVQISSSTVVKVKAREVPGGTLLTYKPSYTPSGVATIAILIMFGYGAPIALALALMGIYRSAVFARDKIIPRLALRSAPEPSDERAKTKALLIDSLSEGRRLSGEAYQAAKSNYEDSIIVGITLSCIGAFIASALVAVATHEIASSAIGGVVLAVTLSVVAWRLVARRAKPRIRELDEWRRKLDLALTREVASHGPSDTDVSSFEIVVESVRELPGWLRILEKSGLHREPILWLMIFFSVYFGANIGFFGVYMYSSQPVAGGLAILAAIVMILLPLWVHRSLKARREYESMEIMETWSGRFESLRSEMEKFLGGV